MSRSERYRLTFAIAIVGLAATACVEHALVEAVRETKYEIPAPVSLPPPTDGAIWQGAVRSGSFLSFDRKARGLGDLVTVDIFENLSAEGSANTTLDGSSSLSANLTSDIGFTGALQGFAGWLFGGLLGISGAGGNVPAGQTVNVVDSNRQSEFAGDGETSRESRFRGTVTCQIVDVLPGEIFQVYGRRQILVNHEMQLVTVAGLVRRHDIGLDNRVASSQLANAKLTFDGIGVIDDKQRPSLLARAMDWLYPF